MSKVPVQLGKLWCHFVFCKSLIAEAGEAGKAECATSFRARLVIPILNYFLLYTSILSPHPLLALTVVNVISLATFTINNAVFPRKKTLQITSLSRFVLVSSSLSS